MNFFSHKSAFSTADYFSAHFPRGKTLRGNNFIISTVGLVIWPPCVIVRVCVLVCVRSAAFRQDLLHALQEASPDSGEAGGGGGGAGWNEADGEGFLARALAFGPRNVGTNVLARWEGNTRSRCCGWCCCCCYCYCYACVVFMCLYSFVCFVRLVVVHIYLIEGNSDQESSY